MPVSALIRRSVFVNRFPPTDSIIPHSCHPGCHDCTLLCEPNNF